MTDLKKGEIIALAQEIHEQSMRDGNYNGAPPTIMDVVEGSHRAWALALNAQRNGGLALEYVVADGIRIPTGWAVDLLGGAMLALDYMAHEGWLHEVWGWLRTAYEPEVAYHIDVEKAVNHLHIMTTWIEDEISERDKRRAMYATACAAMRYVAEIGLDPVALMRETIKKDESIRRARAAAGAAARA